MLGSCLRLAPRCGMRTGVGLNLKIVLLRLSALQALVDECLDYFTTGSIYCNAGSSSSSSSGSTDGWVVNPTLLTPGSRAWQLHYGALPFQSFLPLDPERHAGIAAAPGPRALTQACLADMAALLRGWQACRAARAVSVRLWCAMHWRCAPGWLERELPSTIQSIPPIWRIMWAP